MGHFIAVFCKPMQTVLSAKQLAAFKDHFHYMGITEILGSYKRISIGDKDVHIY